MQETTTAGLPGEEYEAPIAVDLGSLAQLARGSQDYGASDDGDFQFSKYHG